MKRMKTAKTLSLLMALMLVLQLLPLGTALAADAEPADGPGEVVETISGDELGKDVADEKTGTEAPTHQAKVRLFSGSDRTEWLTSLLTLEIKQGGQLISGNLIDATRDIVIRGTFANIPLVDNSGTGAPVLNQGDHAFFEIGDNVDLAGATPASHVLKDKDDVTIGTLTFKTRESDGKFGAELVFDASLWAEDFDYTAILNAVFNASLKHDGTGISEGEAAKDITIIGKDFKIYKPVVPIEPTIEKTGSVPDVDGVITWTVTVNAEKGTAVNQALKGIKFTDTIGAGHIYVDNTFTVKSSPRNDTDVKKSATSLEYTFTEGDGNGPAIITYQTRITDWDTVKYGFTTHNFSNSAVVELESERDTDSDTVTIDQKEWITKTGEKSTADGTPSSDDTADHITWYIEVNKERYSGLTNVVVTDQLDADLTFVSAQWQRNAAADPEASANWVNVGSAVTSKPDNNQYSYNAGAETSDHLRLVIITKTDIKHDDYVTDGKQFTNSATVTWDGHPGTSGSGSTPGIGVGFHALTKEGAFDTDWAQNHQVNWKINLNFKGQFSAGSLANFKVYDLLVHDKSVNTGLKPSAVNQTIWDGLTSRYGQKYVSTGTFTPGLTVNTIQVLDADSNHVADLIEISGFTDDKAYEINFTSKMLDPSAFTKNGTVTVHNTATLFDGTTKRKDVTASPERTVNVLTKTVLAATDNEDGLTGATGNGTADNGFNHVDKTAIFRLSINSSGQKLTDDDFIGKTAITVTDTLPVGWEFVQDYNTQGYKIFEGGTAIVASPDPVTDIEFGQNGDRETATFTFDTLNAHYVILVKAKLTDDAYATLIANNTGKVALKNDASLSGNGGSASSDASVKVDTGGLSKGSSKLKDGIAKWTIDYNPLEAKPASDHDKVIIKDILGQGFEPYLDGSLKMDTTADNGTPRFSIMALTLGIDGGLTETGENLASDWIEGGKVQYDPATRELSIELPNGKQAYRISYLTVLTGAAGKVFNDVEVEGITMKKNEQKGDYTIEDTDASASLGLGGYLRIKKVDSNSTVIADPATFTLSTADGRVIRTGATNVSGILRFGALSLNTEANPHYWLKETDAPTGGYVADSKEYRVVVTESSGNITTTIYDGGKVVGTFTKDTNTNTTFNVTNWKGEESRPEFGNLMIGKTVVNGKMDKDFTFTIDFGSAPSANGIYTSTDNSGNFTTITITDNKATFTLKGSESITIHELPAGVTYTITEDDYTSDGYITTKTGEAGEIAANTTHTATFINTIPAPYIPNSAKISVLKTDEGGNKLPGAVFTLYNSSGSAIATAISNADGIAEFTNVAPNASYTIRETAAPQGYELSNEVISVTTGDGSTLSFTMVNKKLAEDRGSIVITKTDENGVLLPGASFTLYDADGKAVATAASDATGMIRFADIPVGSYTIRETAAPEGYVLSTEVLSIALEKDATRSFTFINRRDEVPGGSTGSIGLLKVNNNGERLAGAEFSLYDADGSLVARAVTGADGIARFTGLPFGTYSVRETVAPEGYKLFEGAQSVTITAATPDRSFTLRNTAEDDPEVGGWEEIPDGEVPGGPGTPGNKLPQTGGVPQTLFLLLAGLALLGAGLFTLKGQKKQRPAAPGTDE